MIAELIAKIKADTTDLDKAGEAVREFEGTVKGAFKRTGDIRPERALEAFVENLTSGNVVGAIESITTKLTGLGLIGGAAFAAIGAGVGFLIKNIEAFDAAMKEGQANRKAAPIAGAPLDDIESHMDKTLQHMDTMGNKWQTFWANWAVAIPGTATAARMLEQSKDLKTLGEDLDKATQKRRESLNVIALGTALGEEETQMVKVRVDAEEKRAKIEEEKIKRTEMLGKMHMPPEMESQARAMIGEDARDARRISDETVAVMDRQVALKDELRDISREAVGPELQALEVTKTRLAYLEQMRSVLDANDKFGRQAIDHAEDQLRKDQEHADTVNAAKGLKPLVEASRLSFQDLLTAAPNSGSLAMIEGHQAALRAQREQTIGENLAKRGFQEDAFIHLARAAEIKAGIPILKESEKNEYAFKSAIDSATVFQSMIRYLDSIASSVSKTDNPFLNK